MYWCNVCRVSMRLTTAHKTVELMQMSIWWHLSKIHDQLDKQCRNYHRTEDRTPKTLHYVTAWTSHTRWATDNQQIPETVHYATSKCFDSRLIPHYSSRSLTTGHNLNKPSITLSALTANQEHYRACPSKLRPQQSAVIFVILCILLYCNIRSVSE